MKKVLKYVLITLSGILVIALLVAVCCFMPVLKSIKSLEQQAKDIISQGSAEDFRSFRTSIVYDCNNEVLFTYSGEKDLYYVDIESVPQLLIDSFLLMEDKKFYSHKGVDGLAVIRATIENYLEDSIVQGASTITQQLARNIYLTQDVNWKRKILEAFMAMELEKKYSKDEILEFYLNNIYFGNGYYGIEAAARGYLNKSVSELTEGECIFLAAIPNNPSRYDPIRYEDNTVKRARLILKTLYDEEKIDSVRYLVLSGTEKNPFVMNFSAVNHKNAWNTSTADSSVYTYITYCAVRQLMRDNGFVFKNDFLNSAQLDRYDFQYDEWYVYWQKQLFTGGYHVYTSIDRNAQKLLQEQINEVIAQNDPVYAAYRDSGNEELLTQDSQYNPLQAAAMTMDNETGFVVAVVGGREEAFNGYGFNRAYQSYRQPGSSIKPLNVYTPYLCQGHSTEETVFDYYNPNGPRNAGGAYAGKMTLREAVQYSKNTIAWQIYRYIGPSLGCDFLLRLGFKKVYPDRNYLACALGGFTYGVSVEEMTAGFHTIYHDGFYNEPTCIRRMTREELQYVENRALEDIPVYTDNAARQMTSMLQTVMEEGTGKRAKLTVQNAAGKTGTTNSNKDMWFVGYTPYYTTGVWVGYDMPKEIDIGNGNLACQIWRDYMDQLHLGLSIKNFEEPHFVSPVTNEELIDLSEIPPEVLQKELELLKQWENDIEIETLPGEIIPEAGDVDAPTAGDIDAPTKGDVDAPTGGDVDAPTGGDVDAPTGGDVDAPTGGDVDAPTGGDVDAPTGGDVDAKIGFYHYVLEKIQFNYYNFIITTLREYYG